MPQTATCLAPSLSKTPMIDDQIRLAAHTKPAFPSRAWVIAYLDDKEV